MDEKQFKVLATESFLGDLKGLPRDEKQRLENAKEQLKTNPFSGKPLGYKFFREKKIGGRRLYYLVYEERGIVLVVAYGGKKDQQRTIEAIKLMMGQYKKEIEGVEGAIPIP